MQNINDLSEKPESTKNNTEQTGIELDDSKLDEAAGGERIPTREYRCTNPACGRLYSHPGNCICGAKLTYIHFR